MYLLKDDHMDAKILDKMLEDGLTTSYKLFWFSGVLDEIRIGNKVISFRNIVCRMISTTWYPLIEYSLNFGSVDMICDLVMLIHKKYNIKSDIESYELLMFLQDIKDDEIEKKISNFYKMVPYRLLTPFFSEELKELPDDQKNSKIEHLSKSSNSVFYSIDSTNKNLEINDHWFNYMYDNENIIQGWLSYKIICFLQKRNPKISITPSKFLF